MSLEANWEEKLKVKDAVDLAELAQGIVGDQEALQIILEGLGAKDNVYRENCFKVVLDICAAKPQVLYAEWDYFVDMLDSANAFHRAIAVRVLARLTPVDRAERFEGLFERYFELLDDDKVMVSRYLVQNVWRILAAKPHLTNRVTLKLLDVEKTRHPESRQALLKADIIEWLVGHDVAVEDKGRVLSFVEKALESSSPKARKAAREFLQRQAESE